MRLLPGNVLSDLASAAAVVVHSVFNSEGPAGLHSRIHGLRIVDLAWVQSGMMAGCALQYPSCVSHKHLFYGTWQFCAEYPDHVEVLKIATAAKKSFVFKAREFSDKRANKHKSAVWLVGTSESLPDACRNRCLCCSDLMQRLSVGVRECE